MDMKITASIDAILSNNKPYVIHEFFDCINLSQVDDGEIFKSSTPIDVYKDIVRTVLQITQEPIYNSDDFFQEEPIGYTDVDHAQEHIDKLDYFLYKYDGWKISFIFI